MAGGQAEASVIPQFYQWFLPQVMNAMTGNTATFNGGAVFIQSANSGLTLVNSTVALNGEPARKSPMPGWQASS